MTRVIAGVAGGRRLVAPAGRTTRPTTDRAREGLFASVGSLLGSLEGLRVLDLYSGSGAVGLEAASRGAAHVLLVESEAGALRAIRRNVADLALPGVEVAAQRVERLVARAPAGWPYDLVYVDPPYAVPDDTVAGVLGALRDRGWLTHQALVVVHRPTREGFVCPAGYAPDRVRRYGNVTLWYGRAA